MIQLIVMNRKLHVSHGSSFWKVWIVINWNVPIHFSKNNYHFRIASHQRRWVLAETLFSFSSSWRMMSFLDEQYGFSGEEGSGFWGLKKDGLIENSSFTNLHLFKLYHARQEKFDFWTLIEKRCTDGKRRD